MLYLQRPKKAILTPKIGIASSQVRILLGEPSFGQGLLYSGGDGHTSQLLVSSPQQ